MADALVLEGVSHAYDGIVALAGIDVRVGPGELVCLLGPSGCGKTTVLRVAAGLEPLQAGRVVIAGREVATPGRSLVPEARGVGLVFQDYALFPHLTVLENVAFGLHDHGPRARREAALAMLERVGMTAHAARYPHALSGGEQQRAALARALAPKPALLLLDEPFSGLDIRLRDEVRDETLKVLDEAEISTLIVTHDPEEAMYMADRIVVMRAGRILQEGSPGEVYRAPANAFIAHFLGEVNWIHGIVERGAVASPLGVFPASGFAEGARVDLLVRPEAVALAEATDGAAPRAEVVGVHLLGHSSIVVLRLEAGGAVMRARIPGANPPAPGVRVGLHLDSRQAFIFPCSGPNSLA